MRSWLRVPATLPGYPQIAALALPDRDAAAGTPGPAQQARQLQHLARRARSPYVLVHPAAVAPPPGWLSAALELLDATPALACVSAGGDGREPRPTLCLEPGAMLARRSALLHSGGLAPRLQGQGAGLDLAWRLWAMGHRVIGLGSAPPGSPLPAVRPPCSVYQATWSWLQILVRNCEEQVLGMALAVAVLRQLGAAGEAAEAGAVTCRPASLQATSGAVPAIAGITTLRRNPAARQEPYHRVGRDAGELLVACHDTALLLPLAFDERRQVQARRRVGDAEIAAVLGRHPLEIVEEQMGALRRAAQQAGQPPGGGER